MNLIDKLLRTEKETLKGKEMCEMEIKRLSEKFGEPFILTLSEISGDRYSEIISYSLDENNKFDSRKLYEMQTMIAAEGIKNPDLKNTELQKHFGCATPKDLAKLLFKGGEMAKIADKVSELSGYSDKTEENIKNLSKRTETQN